MYIYKTIFKTVSFAFSAFVKLNVEFNFILNVEIVLVLVCYFVNMYINICHTPFSFFPIL